MKPQKVHPQFTPKKDVQIEQKGWNRAIDKYDEWIDEANIIGTLIRAENSWSKANLHPQTFHQYVVDAIRKMLKGEK